MYNGKIEIKNRQINPIKVLYRFLSKKAAGSDRLFAQFLFSYPTILLSSGMMSAATI